jgi:hypothetical protein
MEERDVIFRERLIALTETLNSGANREPKLRATVGAYATRMAQEAGARDWVDLKERADGTTYDSMLNLFQKQSEAAAKKGDAVTMRAMEVLALSLIARRQYQADLLPGVGFLDGYIGNCAARVRKSPGSGFIRT